MKACVLHSIGDLRYENVQTPMPGRNEVLLKIKSSGICGSDIPRVFTKGAYHFPIIPGHEFSGEVVELGSELDRSLVGKRAAVFPLLPCRECEACQIGEYAQCLDYNYFGSRCDGGFAEYIVVPLWNLVFFSETLSYEEAAMTEPAAVAIHALRQAGIVIGDNVAILGAGPIGLILAQWSIAWGAEKVFLVDIDDKKVEFAKEIGFEYVCNSNKTDPVEWIKQMTNGRGVDVTVEGTGYSKALEQCLFSVRTFGTIVVMGNPAGDIDLSQKAYWEILRKQLKICGTWNSSYVSIPKNDWSLALSMMEKGKIKVKQFITHRYSLDQCNEAFQMIKNRSEFYNKVMFIT